MDPNHCQARPSAKDSLERSHFSSEFGLMTMAPSHPASGIVLHLDESASSKTVLLVANIVRWVSKLECAIQLDSEAGPVAETADGEVVGCVTISRCLARAGGDVCFHRLFGASPEAQAQIAQWLTHSSTLLSPPSGVTPHSRLAALNVYLQPRAVLFGAGTTITVADIAAFSSIHRAVVALDGAERASLPHLLRWFDYIQTAGDISRVYAKLPIPKPSFNPPSPAVPPLKPAKAADPAPAATGTAQSAAAAAPSPQLKEAPQPNTGAATQGAPVAPKSTLTGGATQAPVVGSKEKGKKENAPAVKQEVDTSVAVLDVRIGVVTKVAKHPNADALYVEDIDLGEAQPRQVVSGLANFLTLEQMQGRRVVVLANVKPGKVRDMLSSGLVLCASNSDHTQCEPLVPPPAAPVGSQVTFPGHEGQPEAVLNPKKKQLEKILPVLKTDEHGVAKFQDVPFTTTAGPCTSALKHAIIK